MSKGEATRERIVDRAWRLASRDGLAGLSLGRLAAELGLSKSGLFAHFGSKQELEIEVLRIASEHFVNEVIRPALKAPRGVPRLRQIFKNWIAWANDPAVPGGCVFLAAATELDDAAGPQRDFLVNTQAAFIATLSKAARIAVEERQFRPDLDCDQFAFEMLGIVLAYHHTRRLLRLPKAEGRATTAFEALLETSSS
ncbi:MAG: TetR/AcrR family transcriptional regulator [Myxococcota bacterium]